MVISFKKIISIFLILSCLICSLCAIGCSKGNDGDDNSDYPYYDYSFYLSDNSVILEEGETFKLIATYGNEVLTYTSSNVAIAEVSENGLITAKASGKAYITVKASDKERICEVEVVEYEYTVSLDRTGTIYAYNDQYTILELVASAKKDGESYNDTYTWSCNDENCTLTASGNKAYITFNGKGEVIITVRTGKGASNSVKVIVIDSEADLA